MANMNGFANTLVILKLRCFQMEIVFFKTLCVICWSKSLAGHARVDG